MSPVPPRAARPWRRRLIVNLVPLLDVLALLIFGLHVQARLAEYRSHLHRTGEMAELRARAERVAEQLAAERAAAQLAAERAAARLAAERSRSAELASELRDAARRRNQDRTRADRLAEELRAMSAELEATRKAATEEDRRRAEARALAAAQRRSDIAMGLASAFGLDEPDLTAAMRGVPPGETEQERLREELNRLAKVPPTERPKLLKSDRSPEFARRNDVLLIHIRDDGTVVLSRPDGPELGRFADYADSDADDVAARLDRLLRPAVESLDRQAVFLMVSWDNVRLRQQRTVAAGVAQLVDFWRNRPGGEARSVFRISVGYTSANASRVGSGNPMMRRAVP